jgi:NAD(P)-dependent dehydrogenase (short-subunit alcohol dehydrogenase family)
VGVAIQQIPLRRTGSSQEQASVICFLASSDADYVTELTIDATGGV